MARQLQVTLGQFIALVAFVLQHSVRLEWAIAGQETRLDRVGDLRTQANCGEMSQRSDHTIGTGESILGIRYT